MRRKGFTLIELLVVLVIVGILLTMVIPNALRAIRQANTKQCASNLRTIDTAAHMCFSETRSWDECSTLDELADYLPDEDGDGEGDELECPFGVDYSMDGDDTDGYRGNRAGHFSSDNWPNTHD